jgi:hypothetical protein
MIVLIVEQRIKVFQPDIKIILPLTQIENALNRKTNDRASY